jgi:hypothetical protein
MKMNKPSKKEKALEKIVQLVCVAIAVFGILLFGSCEQEPCYITTNYSDGSWAQTEVPCDYYSQDYDLQFARANTLSGQYLNYETLVDGVLTERDFVAYWEFTPNAIRFQKEDGGNITTYFQVAISRYEGNTLYTLAGTTEIPYEFTIEDNGDIIITHMSGDYVITYKLSN